MSSHEPTTGLVLENAGVERQQRWLVRHVDLAIEQPGLCCLVGPNGSGKTTTLRMLCGLWVPSEGRALLEGRELSSWRRRDVARRVAFVPQEERPEFDFSVRELVRMGRFPYQGRLTLGRRQKEDEELVEDSMRRTDVLPLAERSVLNLSGGELRRVLIARCLAAQPEILVLDEPTANLDLKHALEVMALCRQLAEHGTAIVMALHDLNAARRFADRVTLFDSGRIVAQGDAATVLDEGRIGQVFGVEAQRVAVAGQELLVFDSLPARSRK